MLHCIRLGTVLMLMPTMALGITVEPLSASEYADTETTTNIPFVVDFEKMSRLEFSVALDSSPTNCVEVSIGTDANEDGALSLDETDYTFGYNCGAWFVRDAVGDEVKAEVEVRGGGGQRIAHAFLLKKQKLNQDWDLVKVVRRGSGEVCELTTFEGKRPGVALIVR